MNLRSSANRQGKVVTEIIHFSDGSKKTIEGIITNTIRQGKIKWDAHSLITHKLTTNE